MSTKKEVNERLAQHAQWLINPNTGHQLIVNDDSFRDVSLRWRVIRMARFDRANLSDTDFHGCGLRNVSFRGAILHNTNFRDADLRGVDFRDADLTGTGLFYARTNSHQIICTPRRMTINHETYTHKEWRRIIKERADKLDDNIWHYRRVLLGIMRTCQEFGWPVRKRDKAKP